MEPIVASLWSSFRRVPPAAVPAMLDCVLASTSASPSSIFTALLNEFPNITKGIRERSRTIEWEWRNIIVSYVAALSHFLKKSDASHMPIFIWKMLIPLLKLLHACDCELFNEVAYLFLDVVKETNSWEVLETIMVPLLLRSIGLSVGVFQSEDLAIYKWSADSTYNGSNNGEVSPESFDDYHDQLSEKDTYEEFSVSNCSDFPLSMSCNVLTLILDAALRNDREGVVSGSTSVNVLQAKVFAGNVLWDLSNLTLQMLSTSVEHRSSAIRLLLPFIFKAFSREFSFEVSVCGQHHELTRTEFFMKIWQSCKLLFSLESLERRDAYDVLSLYLSFPSPTDEHENVNACGREKTFDIRADQQFWDEIKRGLLDKESLVRKQSLHILKTTLNLKKERNDISEKVSDVESSGSTMMSKRGRWADNEAKSLGIGRICNHNEPNDTGRQRWETFVFLYEMLEEYGTHLVEAAWSHQIRTWLQSSFSSEDSVNTDYINLQCDRMTTAKQFFEWLAVLWERGLCHDNPQVRCLIMQSLLDFEWENYGDNAKLVPKDFILGPLIRGLNDPVHHRGFGLKEIYSSWTIDAAARFLHEYVSYMEGREHILFLIDLASVPKAHSLGRAGLVCLAECIASAAYSVPKQCNNGNDEPFDATADIVLVETGRSSSQNDRTELLECLRFVLECSKQHFNPKYRNQVCGKILAAATTLIPAINVPLGILMNFISSLPREYTDYGGSLRHVVQKWLCGSKLQLLEDIGGFPKTFISCNPQDNSVTYSDEELDAWESEAKRWARVLFLLVEEEEHFYPITKFIQDHGGEICKQRNNLEWLAVKFLILVSSLVQELQVIQERTAKSWMTRRTKMDFDFSGSLDHRYFREESFIFDKFLSVLLSFMEELIAFTKLSCSIFWLPVVTGDMTLPGSIRGRLGGPSQRRLSSSLCSSVLEAVTSIKTLAFISWWCAQFSTDTSINCAHAFLWNFCWKIIRFPTCKSEVQAEICIAAHETCADFFKYLVSVFSPLSLDLVVNNDESFPREQDGEGLLDAFISNFLQNINNVIDGGNLARTRRAVLMNWKWSCLESLLSLPDYALRNGVDPEICKNLFSCTVVKEIFDDLIGSLENAGEGSVLSMLRSVRLSIKLLASKRSGPLFSSSDGVTIQMMWLLVNSSWILHVNCNKRRVAPIAALLSSVLHSSVFGDEAMHEFNGEPGPLKWFVEKILEEGTKSPRTIRLAALHLSGLWLAYPNILKYYMEELKLLTFYGSVAFDEDFEGELVENYEARTEVSVLSRSLDPQLTEGFINTELYARVSIAVLFSKLADMVDLANPTVGNEGSLLIVASGKMFLLELLDSVVNDKDLSKELYKKYSAIHRRKVRAWQMICVLSRFIDADIVDQVTSSLHTSIYRNNLPSVRQYMETFAIHIYLKFPILVGQQLVCFLRSYDLRPQALSSYVFIAANVILHSKEAQFRNLDKLLPPIIPLLTSHHHTLRGFTQILVYKVLQTLLPDLNSDESASMSLEKRCFLDLRSYLAQNSDCARLRASMDSYLDGFDPVMSISPAGIFTNRVEDFEFECVPTTLMERVIDFLNNTREDLRSSMAKDAAAIKNESLHIAKGPQFSENLDSNGAELVLQSPKDIIYDFQKKIIVSKHGVQDSASTLFSNDKELYRSLLDMENEDQLLDQLLHSRGAIVEKSKASRQQIILMASLIDRIPNLAGLARTCEVFRAAGLAIADKNILNDKQFQLISVTAEKWVPVLEVPLGSMKVFLEKKKQEGFAILGLEQTANSIPLDHYKFPTKTVLVLGREKEGIPVEFIHMLDACIEIPQLGIVRSLNVHVSGAIALWEYTRQLRQP